MKNELYLLEEFICETINPQNLGEEVTSSKVNEWLAFSNTKSKLLRKLFFEWMTDATNKAAYNNMVHVVQTNLVDWADLVHDYLDSNLSHARNTKVLETLYQHVLDKLENTLDRLEYKYPDYFDRRIKMPRHILLKETTELLHKADLLVRTMKRKQGDTNLAAIIHDYFNSFKEADHADFTYYEVYYAKHLLQELEDALHIKEQDKWENEVTDTLFCQRFDKRDFLKYFKDRIKSISQSHEPHRARQDRLTLMRLEINPLVEDDQCFGGNRKSSREAVLALIDAEKAWLTENEKEYQMAAKQKSGTYVDEDLNNGQLGLLACLVVKAKLTPNQNYSYVVNVYTTFIRPLGVDHNYASSARAKGMNPDAPTAQGVERYLNTLLSTLHREYGSLLKATG